MRHNSLRTVLLALGFLVLLASPICAQNFPAYVNGSPVASNTQAGDEIPLIRGGATFKIDPAILIGGSGLTQLTGDVLAGPGTGSQVATLATSGVGAGIYGDATHVPQCTFDAKGRATSCVNVLISGGGGGSGTVTNALNLTNGAIVLGDGGTVGVKTTATGTGVVTALGVNVGSAGSVVVNGGAGGTPSSLVATNLTGTAAGLTAGTVTTNANLTGPVTSIGNATAITITHNAPADGGSHSYTLLSSDVVKEVDLVSTFTAAAVPQATGSFGSGATFRLCHDGAITATSTTSTINGIAGATGLKSGAHACDDWSSDGTNWRVAGGVPTAGTQDGTTVLANDGTYIAAGAGGGVGTKVATCTLASATCNFNALGVHDYYELKCSGITVSTGATNIILTVNSDTTAAHYIWQANYSASGTPTTPAATGSGNAGAANIQLFGGVGTTDVVNLFVRFAQMTSVSLTKGFFYDLTNDVGGGLSLTHVNGSGFWLTGGSAGTSVQLTTSTGTFGTGAQKCSLYAYDS